MLPVVVVHGGAGHIPKERSETAASGVCSAARAGYAVLRGGGSSMDAVVEAVSQLENNPSFNAGCGSVLNVKGEVEMDAIVMDGKTLGSGAVSAVRNIANPVQLARLVMDKTSHACLTAEGANQFAWAMGVPKVPEESLITEYSVMRWTKNLAPDANPVECQMGKMGTVGAVAVDSEGNIACATSTGGLLNKMVGRVGDTPCIGGGGYADNEAGAVSTTGHGEAIMKVTLARLILFHMEQGQSVEAASDLGLAYMKSRVGGLGGVVTVDPQGHWAARFSSLQMAWAAAQRDTLHYGLYAGKNRGLWLPTQSVVRAMSSAGGATSPYTTLAISHPAKSVTHVELHRPEKLNAMNSAFWREMVDCFNELAADPDCRVVVVSGAGKIFTAGIDLMDMAADILQPQGDDTARISWNLRRKIAMYQETFSVIEKCPKPVVVAVHGACIGGGVDLITACDIRLCTQDAWFQVKEVDIGLAADVGTLQRLPKVIGSRSLVNDLALTARKMYADEAKSSGLVSRLFADKEAMMSGALEMAGEIAGRSPVAVQGTKINLVYARDHSVAEGLDYMATWNMSMLQTDDLIKSAQAALEKKSPKTITFSKL